MPDLLVVKTDLNEYLKSSDIIDYQNLNIRQAADRLVKDLTNQIERIKTIYEFVRDNISHSFDIKKEEVVYRASEVLEKRHGVCYAKSHLVAALLRSLGIPTGFCYQGLIFSEEMPRIVLHGLNAVYIEDTNKWIRLDARGNKEGVNAQFDLEEEKLAFPVRQEYGEFENLTVFSDPNPNVIEVLKRSKTLRELELFLPGKL